MHEDLRILMTYSKRETENRVFLEYIEALKTLSIEFFKVIFQSSLLYIPPSTPPQSFILFLVVLQSVLGCFYLSLLSSIFKKRFTSSTKFYCSFFVVLKSSSCLFCQLVSLTALQLVQLAQIQFLFSVATHQTCLL